MERFLLIRRFPWPSNSRYLNNNPQISRYIYALISTFICWRFVIISCSHDQWSINICIISVKTNLKKIGRLQTTDQQEARKSQHNQNKCRWYRSRIIDIVKPCHCWVVVAVKDYIFRQLEKREYLIETDVEYEKIFTFCIIQRKTNL